MKKNILLLLTLLLSVIGIWYYLEQNNTNEVTPIIEDIKYSTLENEYEQLMVIFNNDKLPSFTADSIDFSGLLSDYEIRKFNLELFDFESIKHITENYNNSYGFLLIDYADVSWEEEHKEIKIGNSTIIKAIHIYKSKNSNDQKVLLVLLSNGNGETLESGQIFEEEYSAIFEQYKSYD